MTEAEALARLKRMTASTEAPALSDDEVTDLLSQCRLVDADGLAPDDAEWTPTYDLSRGAAEGWRWKAAKAAGLHDYETVGLKLSRSQMAQQCLEMARSYARRVVGRVNVPGGAASYAD